MDAGGTSDEAAAARARTSAEARRREQAAHETAELARRRLAESGHAAPADDPGDAHSLDPEGARERAERSRASLVATLRSSAAAHRRAAKVHGDAAALPSGSVEGHHVEQGRHLAAAEADDRRADEVERGE